MYFVRFLLTFSYQAEMTAQRLTHSYKVYYCLFSRGSCSVSCYAKYAPFQSPQHTRKKSFVITNLRMSPFFQLSWVLSNKRTFLQLNFCYQIQNIAGSSEWTATALKSSITGQEGYTWLCCHVEFHDASSTQYIHLQNTNCAIQLDSHIVYIWDNGHLFSAPLSYDRNSLYRHHLLVGPSVFISSCHIFIISA